MRESPGEYNYSEYLRKAGDAFDSLREAEAKQRQVEKELKVVMKKRLRTTDPAELDRLNQDITKLNQQFLFLEKEKIRLVAEVNQYVDKHMEGEKLLDQAETKHIN